MALWIFSFELIGLGPGIYFPVALYSSPLGSISIMAAFWGMLLLWPLLGILISSRNPLCVRFGIGILVAHYLSFPIVICVFEEWNDWYMLSNPVLMSQLKVSLIVSFAVYLSGQCYAWVVISRHFRESKKQ